MTYRHTQSSYLPWMLAAIGVVVLGGVFVSSEELSGSNLAVLAVLVLIVTVGFMFARLTVTVDPTGVVAAFGVGWPRRSIPIGDIVEAQAVRNRWWYGWGVRLIPNGSMYNVWGLDAVELQLRSGKVFRIGTDEPDALLAAVLAVAPGATPDARSSGP